MEGVANSYVERQNLTMRMSMKRFTQDRNAFSKKFANHCHMVTLYALHYNFCRNHGSLRVTPAMEAGLTTTAYDMRWVVEMIAAEEAKKDRRRGPYKKRKYAP